MNQNMLPSLATCDAVTGIEFLHQAPCGQTADRSAFEQSCVDLIARLEYTLATAKEMPKVDYVDESATVAGDMLDVLSEFCDQYLDGKPAEQVQKEVANSRVMCETFEEVLKTRSLGNAVMRTFWKAEESKDIQEAHAQLGESIVRACAAALFHTVVLLGLDTTFGKDIDSSAVVFVNQLKQTW